MLSQRLIHGRETARKTTHHNFTTALAVMNRRADAITGRVVQRQIMFKTKYAHSLTLWSLRLPALITGRGSLLHGLLLGWEMMCAKRIFTNKYNAELSLIKHVNGPKLNQFNVLEGHIRVLMIITQI